MSILRFDVVMPLYTGLPRDVSVNTFHFQAPGGWDDDDAGAIFAALGTFYNATVGGNSLSAFLSPCVSRSPLSTVVKGYNLADPMPRPPRFVAGLSLNAAAWTGSLPLEVALCASYQAPVLAGAIQARRRGRIFLGPLNTGASDGGSGSSFPKPHTGLVTRLNGAVKQLAQTFGPLSATPYSVYSRKNNAAYAIENGWCDNDFDTQRRRGTRPTSRSPWTT